MFSSSLVPWQIGPPQVQVQVHCPSGLSRTCILPLSTLTLQHEGTFHVTPLTSGEFPDPIWGTHPKRALIHHPFGLSKGDPLLSACSQATWALSMCPP